FWSYQAANLAHFGVMSLLAGALVWWGAQQAKRGRPGEGESPISNPQSPISQSLNRLIALSLISLTVLDLFLAHGTFNPASDPALAPLSEQGVPPAVRFINEREGG
ncbi:MAG: hypothetical protein KDE01_27390, partial [Caldilineaceae bacterium]|nr:hypothetical protein [Caldilineaceae bacterium]